MRTNRSNQQFIRRALLLCMSIFAVLPIFAQEGLSIQQVFDGRYTKQQGVTEVLIKGRELKAYQLSLFRSIVLKDRTSDAQWIEQLVNKDTEAVTNKETGRIDGQLYYGFYHLPPKGNKGEHRYLFYRNQTLRNPEKAELTIVYMEGEATLEEIKRIFNN